MTNAKLTPIVQRTHLKTSKSDFLVLLDRDGTLNFDSGYTYKVSDLKLLHNNIRMIKNLTKENSSIICITNQSGIGRGLFSENEAKTFNLALYDRLVKLDLTIEVFYMCPHAPVEGCRCRKPNTLMLELAMKQSKISKENSIYIGDSVVDQIASNKLEVKFIEVPKNEMQ